MDLKLFSYILLKVCTTSGTDIIMCIICSGVNVANTKIRPKISKMKESTNSKPIKGEGRSSAVMFVLFIGEAVIFYPFKLSIW